MFGLNKNNDKTAKYDSTSNETIENDNSEPIEE